MPFNSFFSTHLEYLAKCILLRPYLSFQPIISIRTKDIIKALVCMLIKFDAAEKFEEGDSVSISG